MVTKVLHTVMRVALITISILLLMLSLVLATLNAYLDSTVISSAISDEYIDSLTVKIGNVVEDQCLYIGMPYEIAEKGIDKSIIKELSVKRLKSLADYSISGSSLIEQKYPYEKFLPYISEYLRKLESEGFDPQENSEEMYAEEFAKKVSTEINIFDNNNILIKLLTSFKLGIVQKIAALWFLFPIGIAVCMVLLMFLNKVKLSRGFFDCASALWLGSVLTFIPVFMARFFDLPGHLFLLMSSFKVVFDKILYGMIDNLFYSSMIVFAVTTVILAVSVIVYANALTARQPDGEVYVDDYDDNENDASEEDK